MTLVPRVLILTTAFLSPMTTAQVTQKEKRVIEKKSDGWISLFDGKTLEGWVQKNGTAKYVVKDGMIVGTTEKGSPNSFLCTEKEYADFELEFQVKVDSELNSGVQIRSKTRGDKPDGRVNGPQVEIEASGKKGAFSGYVYGEAAGGWMTPGEDRKAHRHFKDKKWNHYRIVAKGPKIETWINGEKISDLVHEKRHKSHPSGFIGLQVHGVGQRGPFQVAWKDIRLKVLK